MLNEWYKSRENSFPENFQWLLFRKHAHRHFIFSAIWVSLFIYYQLITVSYCILKQSSKYYVLWFFDAFMTVFAFLNALKTIVIFVEESSCWYGYIIQYMFDIFFVPLAEKLTLIIENIPCLWTNNFCFGN